MAPDPEITSRAAIPHHTPRMSPEAVERVRKWHEQSYLSARREGAREQTFDYLGRTIVVPPQVMPVSSVAGLLGEAVLAEVREGDLVLDMGTGSGVNAILAASKATGVLAVDVSEAALAAARANVQRNHVDDVVEVRRSDVFSDADGVFDLIIFDPPFRWFAPRDALEAATTDEDYRTMTSFFAAAKEHLSAVGRMLIFFGTSGDLDYLRELFDRYGFTAHVLRQRSLVRDGTQVEYFTFRVTP
jgi:release factor glutamine methyltransferase